MSQTLDFDTTISEYTPDGVALRGKKIIQLVAESDFISTLFLSLTGKLPTTGEKRILDAIMVASIDHGVEPASGFVPRVVAASGNDVLPSMASTLLALGPFHGGAVSEAMEIFYRLADQENIEVAAHLLVSTKRKNKERISGFGHRKYKDFDPRTQQLFKLARDQQLDLTFINIAQTVEAALETATGRRLVINIDGAIACLLCTLKLDPLAGNGIFGIARVAGSLAHIIEEKRNWQGVRVLKNSQQ